MENRANFAIDDNVQAIFMLAPLSFLISYNGWHGYTTAYVSLKLVNNNRSDSGIVCAARGCENISEMYLVIYKRNKYLYPSTLENGKSEFHIFILSHSGLTVITMNRETTS